MFYSSYTFKHRKRAQSAAKGNYDLPALRALLILHLPLLENLPVDNKAERAMMLT